MMELMENVCSPWESVKQILDDRTENRCWTMRRITKGDFFDQESKIAHSGLAQYFAHVEILREKNEKAYRRVLLKHGIAPAEFLMVGNSLKSDIAGSVTRRASAVRSLPPYLGT